MGDKEERRIRKGVLQESERECHFSGIDANVYKRRDIQQERVRTDRKTH